MSFACPFLHRTRPSQRTVSVCRCKLNLVLVSQLLPLVFNLIAHHYLDFCFLSFSWFLLFFPGFSPFRPQIKVTCIKTPVGQRILRWRVWFICAFICAERLRRHSLLHGVPAGVCATRPVTNDSLTNEVCVRLCKPIRYCLTLSDQLNPSSLEEKLAYWGFCH